MSERDRRVISRIADRLRITRNANSVFDALGRAAHYFPETTNSRKRRRIRRFISRSNFTPSLLLLVQGAVAIAHAAVAFKPSYAYSAFVRIGTALMHRMYEDKPDATTILTVNAGSSSVRLATYRPRETLLACVSALHSKDVANPSALLAEFLGQGTRLAPTVIAHRIVHGGERLIEACLIDSSVEAEITRLAPLAPLHNPVALRWIQACRDVFGNGVLQIAVFDTAFFSNLPNAARTYPLPKALSDEHRLRRYGFHGLAHESMWRRWCALRPDLEQGGRIITVQLGSGCSMAAIDRGKPQDTSMGFSPLEGLMMATRSGDLDPGLVTYLQQREQLSSSAIETILNRKSGLLGISGESDMQKILQRDDDDARLALAMYCHRVRKYLGAYLAVLGGADAVVLGGGVAEHAPTVRETVLADMDWAGLSLDKIANRSAIGVEACITQSHSRMQAWVIPVDEGALLASAAESIVRERGVLR